MNLLYEINPNYKFRNKIRKSIILIGCGLIITSLITFDPLYSIISISCFVVAVFIPNTFLKVYDERIIIDTVFLLKLFHNEVTIDFTEIREVFLLKRGWDLGKFYKNRIGFNLIKRSSKLINQIGSSEDFLKAFDVISELYQKQIEPPTT
jgi:hypothetical protein